MPAMATFLDLPREIYLMVCSLLTTAELTSLASVSRDHYLAVQQPLFNHVHVKSYNALVKLVGTLMKVPVVSHISPKSGLMSPVRYVRTDVVHHRQRQHWHKLSDAQLREREIRHINLGLDKTKDASKITGAVLSRCIGAIARKCGDVKISLTFTGLSEKLIKELQTLALPNVTELTLFLGPETTRSPAPIATGMDDRFVAGQIWPLTFSGSTFPDLRRIYMNSLAKSAAAMPSNMEQSSMVAEQFYRRRRAWYFDNPDPDKCAPFYGLLKMQEVKLELNAFLDARILKSLFSSSVVPQHLTKLEIVNCPRLHPIKDLGALATLLQRGFQLLRFLKLHLSQCSDGHDGYHIAYRWKIVEHPEHHLCNIVRELGQKIKGLDLALPFACDRMLVPPSKHDMRAHEESRGVPDMPPTPVSTLPQRLMAAGYRYRRLIFNDFCRDDDAWDNLVTLAARQGEKISWELLYDAGLDAKAVWLVSGCAPVEFSVEGAMKQTFNEA